MNWEQVSINRLVKLGAELLIDGEDARDHGIRMGQTFISALDVFVKNKDTLVSNSRLNDGQQRSVTILRIAPRELTLPFVVYGRNAAWFRQNRNWLEYKFKTQGKIDIVVPVLSTSKVYRLYYVDSSSYALSRDLTHCKVSVKFIEDDPTNRALIEK